MFTTLFGRPIAPNSDYHEWWALLERAGVRHARLHDARHTAATVLLVPRRPGANGHVDRGLVEHLPWPARYQYVTEPIRREVANRVGGLLFGDQARAPTHVEPSGQSGRGRV